MFDFLRSNPAPEFEPERDALPEPSGTADAAVEDAPEPAIVETVDLAPEPEPAAPATTIAAQTRVEGSLETRSDVVVHGIVAGDLTSGALVVELEGKVEGDVLASGDVVIRGTVLGDVSVEGKITIAATGKVVGNVDAYSIALAEGGELHGRCTMSAPKPSAPKPSAPEPHMEIELEPEADESFIGRILEDLDAPFAAPEVAVG